MAAKVQLNNFRFSIYIDVDGTVTLTDLPPELREVAEALDPAHGGGTAPVVEGSSARQTMSDDLVAGTAVADSCRRMA
jgi:phosphatidate phosphatase APP1